MKAFVSIFLIFIAISLFAQESKNEFNCLRFFQRFEEPWKKDSLGQNGFRTLVYFYFKSGCRECSLDGLDWEQVENVLGPPNQEFLNSKQYWMGLYDDEFTWWIALRLNINPNTRKINRTIFEHN